MVSKEAKNSIIKDRLHEIIFEADTPEGKLFDIVLLISIVLSVIIVMLESVPKYQIKYSDLFKYAEWCLTVFFTIEYLLRLYCTKKPVKYAKSFFGVIDLVSILPTYISLLLPGSQSLMVIRGLRLMRIFRIFKLGQFISQGNLLIIAIKASRWKVTVFIVFIMIMVSIFGALLYLVEGRVNPQFDSIPRSVYWAIVTITTVGYGDIAPRTSLGQFIAAIIMLSGYAIIAVPTGIVTSEMLKESKSQSENISTQTCKFCSREGHDVDALHCKYCGEEL